MKKNGLKQREQKKLQQQRQLKPKMLNHDVNDMYFDH